MESLRDKVYIAKPENSSQGKGIFLITGQQDVKKDCRLVIQEYINK